MEKMDKPIPCKEKWSNMTPTEGGRICKSCTKLIVDFRKKTWTEIEKKQSENNNSICGIYSKKQLNNWGQKTVNKIDSLKKIAAVAAVSTALTVNTFAQNESNQNKYITVKGTISTDNLNRKPISNAIIKFDTLGTMTKTDSNGNYSISILKSKIKSNTIELSAVAETFETEIIPINIDSLSNDSFKINTNLKSKPPEVGIIHIQTISFYAAPPTLLDTAKEKLKTIIKSK
jgi:hypothetical protein